MTTNGLVELIEATRIGEPVLITEEVDALLEEVCSLSYNQFFDYDRSTRRIEERRLLKNELREVYARRLLAALFFGSKLALGSYMIQKILYFAYDRAGTMANALHKADNDDQKPKWLVRSMITRSRSAEINKSIGNNLDAFFSYVFSAGSAMRLISYIDGNYLKDPIPMWTRERTLSLVSENMEKAKRILNTGLSLRNDKVFSVYKSVNDKLRSLG